MSLQDLCSSPSHPECTRMAPCFPILNQHAGRADEGSGLRLRARPGRQMQILQVILIIQILLQHLLHLCGPHQHVRLALSGSKTACIHCNAADSDMRLLKAGSGARTDNSESSLHYRAESSPPSHAKCRHTKCDDDSCSS